MTARPWPAGPIAVATLAGLLSGGCDHAGKDPERHEELARAAPNLGPAPEDRKVERFSKAPSPASAPTPLPAPVPAESPAVASAPPPAPASALPPATGPASESYARIEENPFRRATEHPLSTFGVDVDTASYANVRRFLTQNTLPPRDAVRVEELVNYFPYDYPSPAGDVPFSVLVEVGQCPWAEGHRLARIGLKGREVPADQRPASNLVFLVDVSGSMSDANKLPLVKSALGMLVRKLGENDRVAVVVYAGASGLALPSTACHRKAEILAALEDLRAGGSTNGGAGLKLAYDVAVANFIRGGTNRVILCTDGDFNVGITGDGELTRLIEDKAKSGVFLSTLGFGMGNYKDATMERLADRGNGFAAYIDSPKEAAKVLVEQMSGTLVTIAKDVKIQVEFNPARVRTYRLIGYEDRLLKARDFNDDRKDAGEIGAGHTVTALYEIEEADLDNGGPGVDPLRYRDPAPAGSAGAGPGATRNELFAVKVRHKPPTGDESEVIGLAIEDDGIGDHPSDDFRFASAVAAFGLLLRDSPARAGASWADVIALAESSRGPDRSGHRGEFIELARKARSLAER